MIILPDIHGRTFWKEAVKDRENEEILFLGDYVDPYQYEGINEEEALVNFEDILKFAKEHEKNVHMLLGNHDCGYIWSDVCSSRRSRALYSDLRAMFLENMPFFDLAYKKVIGDNKYLFTHSGVHKAWYDSFTNFVGVTMNIYDNIDFILNNALHCNIYEEAIQTYLGMYSYFRGWGGEPYGSCVWADVREWSSELPNFEQDKQLGYYQIFSHTQLELEPIVRESFACLDVRRPFELTDDNILIDLKHPTGAYEYNLNKE